MDVDYTDVCVTVDPFWVTLTPTCSGNKFHNGCQTSLGYGQDLNTVTGSANTDGTGDVTDIAIDILVVAMHLVRVQIYLETCQNTPAKRKGSSPAASLKS